MLTFGSQFQKVPLPGTGGTVASPWAVCPGLGTEVEVKDRHEEGSSLCTTENDKDERDKVFTETPQR